MKHRQSLSVVALLLTAIALSGCFINQSLRNETAKRIAAPAFMVERDMQAGQFALKLYERIHDRGGIADIYIEGDDLKTGISPTPKNAIALQLAARDKAKNVIYVARPCQYNGVDYLYKQTPLEDNSCDIKYTTTHRFAPEVIESYNAVLDELRARWDIRGFHIYGHSGGAAIATLLAAERKDILSLTTVEGILDTDAYTHQLAQFFQSQNKTLEGSLNPKDVAPKLRNLPQNHYLGGDNELIVPAILHSYLDALGPTNCAQYKFIQENGYTEGWTDKWPSILKDKPVCHGPIKPVIQANYTP